MKKELILSAVVTTLLVNCTPYGVSKTVVQQEEESKNSDPVTVSRNESSGPVHLTFLDTLNRGNEIGLKISDSERASMPVSNTAMNQNESVIRYKIQLFASSQIETVRDQKREMEEKIDLPLSISFEAPYYKLLAGNFTQRASAEDNLKKLKKLGYTDAWIITTKSVNN